MFPQVEWEGKWEALKRAIWDSGDSKSHIPEPALLGFWQGNWRTTSAGCRNKYRLVRVKNVGENLPCRVPLTRLLQNNRRMKFLTHDKFEPSWGRHASCTSCGSAVVSRGDWDAYIWVYTPKASTETWSSNIHETSRHCKVEARSKTQDRTATTQAVYCRFGRKKGVIIQVQWTSCELYVRWKRNESPILPSFCGRSDERGLFVVVSVVLRPRPVAWSMGDRVFVGSSIHVWLKPSLVRTCEADDVRKKWPGQDVGFWWREIDIRR